MKSRTHRCGELNRSHVGQTVVLNGWVQRRRDHGAVLFVDVRDRTGITQVVFNAERNASVHEAGQALRSECVVSVTGTVAARPDESRNANLATGDIEVLVDALEILNEAKTPPFVIEDEADVTEALRLKIPLSGLAPSPDATLDRSSSCRDASHEELPQPGRISGNRNTCFDEGVRRKALATISCPAG